jgi:hypothetical protein
MLASQLAHLPPSALLELEHAPSFYNVGWSHGKELMNGRPDHLKGSFYANPVMDAPTPDEAVMRMYPEYAHPNLWPRDMPELRDAFMDLGGAMMEVGALVARECDRFRAHI